MINTWRQIEINISTSLDEEEESLCIPLNVDMNVGIGGDTWPAAELFCKYILDHSQRTFFERLFAHRDILELGSGHGLCGIALEKSFCPNSISITDLSEYLPMIDANIELNQCIICKSFALDWKNLEFGDLRKFDVIIAMECVYRVDLYAPLIDAYEQYHRDSDSVFILGITRDFAKQSFFPLLTARGYSYRKIPVAALRGIRSLQKYDLDSVAVLFVTQSVH